ncbi:hypothetical protein E5A73_17585 [Sphingomonas gei]|uniref:Aspartate-semialdehyde dehydrogenase n=1 Tax=Sphingomonas gei TaxID=1395960 RepID=A0A4S1X2R7_9SPHN|nr:hypothetical protein [Sphingomonas gei]TGX50234.1 hypothetical protein E5A73_17585 [Sphingomonas gei]
MLRVGLLIAPLALAGCGGSEREAHAGRSMVITGNENELIVPVPQSAANAAEASEPVVNLAPDGLSLVFGTGGARQVTFGMPRAAVTEALAKMLGSPIEEGDDQECGAGALSFASFRGGLGAYFDGGKFVGWDLDGHDGGRFVTAAGVGIGATRKQLESATAVTIEDSTLGIEFSAGGMSGLLSARDAGGEVTNLWAGATCIAR